jgi:hypothetical protein
MSIRVGINGYGRIGRNVLRALYESGRTGELQIVAINDLGDAQTNAHLTRYDTAHGKFPGKVEVDGDYMVVNGDKIRVLAERDPAKLPWGELKVDVVFECTGLFTTREKAGLHLKGGAKKVIISAPASDTVDATVVFGVNHKSLKASDEIISNASCTTNCLTPVAKVLQEVKRLEHEGYEFEAAEASFELLLRRLLGRHKPLFELDEYRCDFVRSGAPGEEWNKCVAAVKLRINGDLVHKQGGGDGPVNALDAALRSALQPSYPAVSAVRLADYKVRIINGQAGTAARTRVLVTSTDGHESWGTVGVSDNIIEASWLALVDALEHWIRRKVK